MYPFCLGGRERWTEEENEIITREFKLEIRKQKKVRASKIREVQQKYKLEHSEAKIRSKISNYASGKAKMCS